MAARVRNAKRRLSRGLAALIATGCIPGQEEPAPPERSAEEIVNALLERHHGPLRGTFANSMLELRAEPDGAPFKIVLSLPDRMRVDHPGKKGEPGKRVDLLVEGVGWRCESQEPAARLVGEELQQLRNLQQHLEAMLFMPLYRADKIESMGGNVIRLILPGGETWRLEVDPNTKDPIELRGSAGPVRFLSFLQTRVTRPPKKVDLPGRGAMYATFLASDLSMSSWVFTDPSSRVEESKPVAMARAVQPWNELPTHPELQEVAESVSLAVADPGTWPERMARIIDLAGTLEERGQISAGLPTYALREGGVDLLVPFQSDPQGGHRPFIANAEDQLRRQPTHRAVVVSPPPGKWDDVIENGRAMLDEFLDKNALAAAGPLRCIPFLLPDQELNARVLGRLQVRMELPVTEQSGR